MFLVRRPSPHAIDAFLRAQRDAPFSYPEVGWSVKLSTTEETEERRMKPFVKHVLTSASSASSVVISDRPPAGYTVDRYRIRIGHGEAEFAIAASCLRRWRMFDLGWVSIWPGGAAFQPATTVAVAARTFVLWSLNACRIVYVEEEAGWRCSFAYGTLTAHAESGEERFSVERRRDDESVWYDILAFSRPRQLAGARGLSTEPRDAAAL